MERMSTEKNKITPEFVGQLLENAKLIIPEDGVYEKLRSAEQEGKQLRIKMGFDPTSPDLHLGHAVPMRQLKRFQDLGHKLDIIIGDFTGQIGDPSGRNKSRPLATKEDLTANAKTYITQLGKVIDISTIEVHRNSEWLESMSLEDVIRLLAQGSLSQVISRDDFRKRLDAGSPIALHEIIYPFLQGMDSIAVEADIEVGGIDQLYAFQAARMLQGNRGDDPQSSVFMPLLRGLDGEKKMSKSLGNYVGLSDAPRDMFGKLMSIPDTLIDEYLRLASGFTSEEVSTMLAEIEQGRNPMDVKMALAQNITETYHDLELAEEAAQYFTNQFRNRNETVQYDPVEIVEVDNVIDLLLELNACESRSQARRLIEQGGVVIDGSKVQPDQFALENVDNLKIRVGKKRFYHTKVKA